MFCSPALGGILAGYELARALGVRFIFTERVNDVMCLRRGFEIKENEKILVCEDIITTGGSAMESAKIVESLGGKVVGYAALANRGICNRHQSSNHFNTKECKLDANLPLFALEDFIFETFEADNCPLCQQGNVAIKPEVAEIKLLRSNQCVGEKSNKIQNPPRKLKAINPILYQINHLTYLKHCHFY